MQNMAPNPMLEKLVSVKARMQVSEPKEEFYPSVTVYGGPK